MGPTFCPPCKTSTKLLKETQMTPYWPPPLSTPPYRLLSDIYYRPLLFTYLITPSLFSFLNILNKDIRISVPKKRGGRWGPLAYLSKQLDLVMLRWPPCLQALAATTPLIPAAQKLTRNAPLNVCSPHSFKDLLFHGPFLSLPAARLQILHAHHLDPSLSLMAL